MQSGQETQAMKLADALLADMRIRDPSMLQPYFRMGEVQLLTYTGRLEEAVASFRRYVDEGFASTQWSYNFV